MKKKIWCFSSSWNEREKKTELPVAGWATAHVFLSLSHNTASCIVTSKARRQRRGALGRSGTCSGVAMIWPGHVHDTAW